MKPQKNTAYIKTTVFVVAILVFAGMIFMKGNYSFAQSEAVTVETPSDSVNVGNGSDILVLLDQMKNITLDNGIFTNPLFLGLTDFTIELTEEPISRPDPFAPIGQDAIIIPDQGTSITTSPFTASGTPPTLPSAPKAPTKAPTKIPVKK